MLVSDRPLADQIILWFAATVCVGLLVVAVGVVAVQLVRPDEDISAAAEGVGSLLHVLLGVLLGFLAGRRRNGGSA